MTFVGKQFGLQWRFGFESCESLLSETRIRISIEQSGRVPAGLYKKSALRPSEPCYEPAS